MSNPEDLDDFYQFYQQVEYFFSVVSDLENQINAMHQNITYEEYNNLKQTFEEIDRLVTDTYNEAQMCYDEWEQFEKKEDIKKELRKEVL